MAIEEALNDSKATIQKAAVTNATYTIDPDSRNIFSPENLDPVVKLLVPTSAPVRELLPRTKGMGQAASWEKLTSALDPGTGGTGTVITQADASTAGETTQTYSDASATYKILSREVEVGKLAIDSGRPVTDMMDQQIKIKTLEVILGEEDMILNGDSSADANAFDGLAKSITTNSGTASLLTASGVNQYACTLFGLGGSPTHMVINSRQARALADEAQGSGTIQRIMIDNQGNATGGLRMTGIVNSTSPDGMIKLVVSRYCGAWAYLLTVKSPAGENWIEMEDQHPLAVYDVPDSNHAVKARVYEHTVLKMIGEPFQYKIGGLATTC